MKLDSEDLGSLPHGSKIDTLLLGHPLVVTTLSVDEYASLNGARVSAWNLNNDGGLIIHGIDDFFDPAFQTLIYPRFDMKKDIHAVVSGLTLVVKELTENPFLLLALVVIGRLVFSFCRFKDEDKEYERLKQQEEEEVVDHVLDVKAVYV